jgi:hypothetical protein
VRARIVVALIFLASPAARSQDRFEIQVYDSESAPAGGVGIETHVNQVVADTAETHVTFEPHYGLTPWLELGGYFQTAITGSDGLDYAGVKLRLKARLPDKLWLGRVGLAVNGEIAAVPARFEANVWGSEIRPIIDLTIGRFYASVNPILDIDLQGELAGHPQLQPAAKVAVRMVGTLSIGAEWYAAFGPLDDLGAEHFERILAAADWSSSWIDLNLGAGHGWGTDDRWVVKMIVGVHPPER